MIEFLASLNYIFSSYKSTIICVLIYMIGCSGFAQKKMINYTQSIKGTEVQLELIFIKAGDFKMGSQEWAQVAQPEKAQHPIPEKGLLRTTKSHLSPMTNLLRHTSMSQGPTGIQPKHT